MGSFKKQDGAYETFLPAIPKAPHHVRHASQSGADGRLLSQQRHGACVQDAAQKEMAALQRNYESMSLTVQSCQAEVIQVWCAHAHRYRCCAPHDNMRLPNDGRPDES